MDFAQLVKVYGAARDGEQRTNRTLPGSSMLVITQDVIERMQAEALLRGTNNDRYFTFNTQFPAEGELREP